MRPITSPLGARTRRRWLAPLAGLLAGLITLPAAAQSSADPTVVVVERGDTFSAIATRFGVAARQWRQLYDAERSGLSNPNLLLPGQKLELVSGDGGRRYLRLQGSQQARASAPAPTPSAPPAPATPPPVAVAPAVPPAAPPAPDTLTIGVLPNIPAPALLAQYESLKRYLERNNPSTTVRIVVPANFKAFFDGTMSGEFDVSVGAPNLQRVAQLERGHAVLGMYEPRIGALFVTPSERGVGAVREIAGQAVGFANPQSLVALYGQQWLRGQNLEAGRDYEIKGARSDMGVGRMMLTGEAVAGIMSNGEYRALPPEESVRLKIVEVFARIPNFIWLAHPRLERARVDRLRTQLRGFFADKDEGAAFAKATGLSAIVDADEAVLRELDAFNVPTRRAMGVAPR